MALIRTGIISSRTLSVTESGDVMGRKPKGEKALTGAERQKLYRQRHKPRNRRQEFRLKLLHLVSLYENFIDLDAMDVMIEELGEAYTMENYLKRFGDRESTYIDRWYSNGTLHQRLSLPELVAEKKEKNKEYQAEKDAKKAMPAKPVDPVEAGKVIAALASML